MENIIQKVKYLAFRCLVLTMFWAEVASVILGGILLVVLAILGGILLIHCVTTHLKIG